MFDTWKPGPMYEDFAVGAVLPAVPAVTLTEADNVLYRAISGDQHPFAASAERYRAAGGSGALANPGLVMQYSIGQSTMATRQAIANLYYRQVRILRQVEIGETLTTETRVLGLADAAIKGGQHRGKVWLGITTSTDRGAVVTYERCALVRGRGPRQPGHRSEIPGPGSATPLADLGDLLPAWQLGTLVGTPWPLGEERVDPLRDHIELAPALARLTFNQAAIHRDHTASASGRRLVYGGHVQALAQASLTRMLPGLAAVVAWDGCDHLAPATEGDLLEFRHTPLEEQTVRSGRLVRLDIRARRLDESAETAADILHWTPIVWTA